MVLHSNNPWERETRSQLVAIQTHKLHVSTSGPSRRRGEPVIVMCTGGGVPAVGYVRLQRLFSQHWRVYFYDRTGYDRSERGPYETLTAQQAALELRTLLENIAVGPPYVLIGNSYGGIIARAFLDIMPKDSVTGLLLADAGTELMYHLYPRIPSEALGQVGAGIDMADLTNFREECKLTDEEYKALVDGIDRTKAAADAEDNHGSAYTLAQSRQYERSAMHSWPVAVVRCNVAKDLRLLYNAGVERGQGTSEQRELAMAFIHSVGTFLYELCSSQLELSGCHRYTKFPSCGHDDILRRPEAYVEEMEWIMAQHRRSQFA